MDPQSKADDRTDDTRVPPRRQRPWRRFGVYLVVIYAAWCVALYVKQDGILFPSDLAPSPMPGEKYDLSTTVLKRPLPAGGEVVAWFIPCAPARAGRPAPLIVFCHGNAELIDYQDHVVQGYLGLGCSVLLPEYRGYGRSAGTPSQDAITDDVRYFLDEALRRPDVDAARIVYHGRSLGGGPASQLALHHKPAALVLESTFTSVAGMARKYLAPSFLARHPFRNDDVVTALDVPVLVMHGTHDDIIPVAHGRKLAALARDGVLVEFDCAHNDFPGDSGVDRYWEEIRRHLVRAGVIDGAADR
jgi:hypothetical protein